MKSILTDIFHFQMEEHHCGEQYKDVNNKLTEYDDFMTKALKDNKELLDHYNLMTNALDEYDSIAVKDFYELGFKSGFCLALDIFDINQIKR